MTTEIDAKHFDAFSINVIFKPQQLKNSLYWRWKLVIVGFIIGL